MIHSLMLLTSHLQRCSYVRSWGVKIAHKRHHNLGANWAQRNFLALKDAPLGIFLAL